MSIAVFLPTLWIGGAEKLHVYLINEWIKAGHEVELIVLFDSTHNIDVESLIDERCKKTFLNLKSYKHSIFSLIKFFYKNKHDFFLVPMWPLTIIAIFAWMLNGCVGKIIISEHTNISASSSAEINTPLFLIKLSIFIFYRFANGIIAVSKGVKNDIENLGKINSDKIKVIYNPSALGIIKPTQKELKLYSESLWKPKYKFKFLGVGSLKEQKNFSLLIEAFSKLEPEILADSQLIILGDGPLMQDLLSQVNNSQLSDQISLPGRVLNPYPWFQSANVFVLSSSWEGFGNVLVEALECSLPIVSTDCLSGPSEILLDGLYGKLVPVNDADALSKGMHFSLTAKHDLQKLYQRSQDFTVQKISSQYLQYFQNQ